MDILKRLKELQKQRGWSDYKIAKESNLSPNTVSNIYKRNNIPSTTSLQSLCKAFGITLSQFFAENEMIELTPELKELFEKWQRLNDEQKNVLWQLIKSYENK